MQSCNNVWRYKLDRSKQKTKDCVCFYIVSVQKQSKRGSNSTMKKQKTTIPE